MRGATFYSHRRPGQTGTPGRRTPAAEKTGDPDGHDHRDASQLLFIITNRAVIRLRGHPVRNTERQALIYSTKKERPEGR